VPRLPRYCRIMNAYREQVDAYLEATYGNRRYRRVRDNLLKNLIDTLIIGKRPKGKLPDRKLTAILRDLERRIAEDRYRISKAWYEHRVYGASRRIAAFRWDVNPRELKYLEALWSELRCSWRAYKSLIVQTAAPWAFDVDEIHEDVTILLDDRAIEDIVLVALEAYTVPRKGVQFTETYGICFGSTKSTEEKRHAHGYHTTRYVYVSSVHVQLRAELYRSKVTYDLRSLDAQMAVAKHLFPQLDIVGDFHTHPYKGAKELRTLKGWRYSAEDEAGIAAWVAPLTKMGYHPRTSLIVGITKGSKRISKPGQLKPNVVRFSIDKYHFYVACYRIIGNRYSDKYITLNATALPGM
jgi:hypothetical protein